MNQFKNLNLKNDVLSGKIKLLGNEINIELDMEEDGVELKDFSELISDAEEWIQHLSDEKFERLKETIAKELTDSAYAESNYIPDEKDYTGLKQELVLTDICFYPESVITLNFVARQEYPDGQIFCQLGPDLEIEDLIVE